LSALAKLHNHAGVKPELIVTRFWIILNLHASTPAAPPA
jgi:hypothetical protein